MSEREKQRGARVFQYAVRAIEGAAASHEISRLQSIRAKNLGLRRVSRRIFPVRNRGNDWTIHYGGRNELQFNLGIDQGLNGTPAFRFGVAFSLEPSRSLPNISVLLPKVVKFNHWMQENPEALSDLTMWHWRKGSRSADYSPGPIPATLFDPAVFILLGGRQPLDNIDPHSALTILDRLMPLYEFVESHSSQVKQQTTVQKSGVKENSLIILGQGRISNDLGWSKASVAEKTINVFLRHRKVQLELAEALRREGYKNVQTETQLGQYSIDLTANYKEGLHYFEVKIAASARICIREAVGQLLEYALWPGAPRPQRLVVVGEPELDNAARTYLARLNKELGIPIDYRTVALRT